MIFAPLPLSIIDVMPYAHESYVMLFRRR